MTDQFDPPGQRGRPPLVPERPRTSLTAPDQYTPPESPAAFDFVGRMLLYFRRGGARRVAETIDAERSVAVALQELHDARVRANEAAERVAPHNLETLRNKVTAEIDVEYAEVERRAIGLNTELQDLYSREKVRRIEREAEEAAALASASGISSGGGRSIDEQIRRLSEEMIALERELIAKRDAGTLLETEENFYIREIGHRERKIDALEAKRNAR